MGIKDKLGRGEPRVPKKGSNMFDRAGGKIKGLASGNSGGKVKPNASTWEQLSAQDIATDNRTRDVHNKQQLTRGTPGEIKSMALPNWVATIVGIVVFIIGWLMWGVFGKVFSMLTSGDGGSDGQSLEQDLAQAQELGVPPYFRVEEVQMGNSPLTEMCYLPIDPNGAPLGDKCFSSIKGVPRPDWHVQALHDAKVNAGLFDPQIVAAAPPDVDSWLSWLFFGHVSFFRVAVVTLIALLVGSIVHISLKRMVETQNLRTDHSDINQHDDDAYIAPPQEVITKYDVFPDLGAHSPVMPSSMLSHAAISNSGLKKIDVPVRHEADVVDEEGNIVSYKGEIVYDDDGEMVTKSQPMIDTEMMHKLFDASGLAKNKNLRTFFNPEKVKYNPGGENREKYGKAATLAQHINEEWTLPDYEPQRPAGVYIVDPAPVNTMMLAMTRAGKGQTYIEPMIDMWLREARPNNMVVNDPKGELLVKFYVRAATRGFQVVQFNLINALKTDIYNPLGLAAEAAREGDTAKTATYVENIAEVFFPVDGADDPVWPSAANNAFKRTAYGMIDFYLEEERQMRKRARAEGWDLKVLETRLDEMWGKVTLYNCYQFFVKLSAKKLKDPMTELNEKVKAGKFGSPDTNPADELRLQEAKEKAEADMILWDGNQELDMLTLFFNATDTLPSNSMRDLVGNADKSLRAMGAAEKMLASVYGIAITAMAFFTDPTISTLTSGTPSQNTDLAGLSFPRRIGVRLNADFVKKYKLVGKAVKWSAYEDENFSKPMKGKFSHDDTVSREGWARYLFEGIFPTDLAYLKLEIQDDHGLSLRTFHFRFVKGYQTNLKGSSFITDPVTGKKLAKNGVLVEMRQNARGKFVPGTTTFKQSRLNVGDLTLEELSHASDIEDKIRPVPVDSEIVQQTQVRYSEQTKAVFLITPPHLMKYAKLILILLKQLVDLNFDQSYMSKSSQKPLYKTRFMLDELGNLQSEGHGIAGFETMLSIGLGQEQQFTLILQTLQQLRDVYGDSVDKIVQGNAQPLSAKIATPSGWSTMGEMEVGTKVLTPAGGVAEVDGVHPRGKRKVYRVTRADGSSTLVCGEHLWAVGVYGKQSEET